MGKKIRLESKHIKKEDNVLDLGLDGGSNLKKRILRI
jgi:hypothetical protein